MRDILLTLIFAALVPAIIRRPEIGAYAWVWVSMMNPHKLTYGFAYSLPFAQAVVVLTLLGYVFKKEKQPLPMNGGVALLLLLILWVTITSFFAIGAQDLVWDRWIFFMKTQFMLFFTLLLLRDRKQIEILIWLIVLSIGFYGVKGGIWTVLTGGGGRVWGPAGGLIQENNSLAVALVMILPLVYYLMGVVTKKWLRWGLIASMVSIAFSILGSQSRGALVALLAMAALLGIKGKYPVRSSVALLILVAGAIAFMPATWVDRMDTIQTYSSDSSAMSRVYTWHTMWNAALDRPLVGAGFAADNSAVFTLYAPNDEKYEAYFGKAFVAHSIYFQALGEHGFPGLLLYAGLWVWVWFSAGRTAKAAEAIPGMKDWVPSLMRMCQVSMVGFCAGGAFLSMMYFDFPYYLIAIVTLTQCAIKKNTLAKPWP